MRVATPAQAGLLLLAAIGCGPQRPPQDDAAAPPAAAPAAAPVTIADRDWILTSLGERTSPMGSENQPLTLRLDAAATRASGFAGCNRFTGTYTLAGDSLSFGPLATTRMACAGAAELEQAFLAAMAAAKTYQATDSSLTLNGAEGPVARFRPQ